MGNKKKSVTVTKWPYTVTVTGVTVNGDVCIGLIFGMRVQGHTKNVIKTEITWTHHKVEVAGFQGNGLWKNDNNYQ